MKEQNAGVKWFNTEYYPQYKTARAVRYEDGILPRLRQSEVTLFTPWGPRYNWRERGVEIQSGDREEMVLLLLARLLSEWQDHFSGQQFRWVFLAADLYGCRINRLPEQAVAEYFASLAGWVAKILPTAEFRLWSYFDEEAEPVRQDIRQRLPRLVGPLLIQQAERTARILNAGGNATDYLVERLTEAQLIENRYRPIKLAAVSRQKDDGVDGDLPRLYFVPPELQAPWL